MTPSRAIARSIVITSLVLVASAAPAIAPLAAQRPDTRRAPRAATGDSIEMQLRRIERAADSLGRLFDDEDLSAAERRRIGSELDRIIAQYQLQSIRLAQLSAENQTRSFVRVQVGPITGATLGNGMENALTESITREAMPAGWIGIVLDRAATESRVERGELIMHYFSYPLITTVEPSSPAQRAGLVPNDTLLAYNGLDVRDEDISMTRLLKPNTSLTVRIRRDGRVRELPVSVIETPARIKQRRDDEIRNARTTWVLNDLPSMTFFPRRPPPAPGSVGVPRAPRPGVPQSVSITPPFPPPLPPTFAFTQSGVAGAQMVTVTEALGKTLGIQSGVLVADAPAGSLAAESGLRDGDVIVKVERQPVRSVTELWERIQQAFNSGERSVELETVREKRARKVTLRWNR
ncbi:MAG: PDZ domain-containing protein [Gemmatimonadaceae bacterium]